MAKLFLFGIGGTGARVIRSFTMMMASGFSGVDTTLEVVPIILDHDKGNGDLTRTTNLLSQYQSINKSLYPDAGSGNKVYDKAFFLPRLTPLNSLGVSVAPPKPNWHVEFDATANQASMKYSDYIGLSSLSSNSELVPTEHLIDALYDNSPSQSATAELNLQLDKGFKGNPSIGTVVFDELKNDPGFKTFLNSCNPANGDKVFIVGSIFGGTGSSGVPVIVDEIRKSKVGNVNQVPIGVALVLPYFKLQAKAADNTEDTGAIDASIFNAKTKAALGAYSIGGINSFNNKVTDLYYIGDNYVDAYEYHEGRNKQVNPSHVVEWVAATAIINFLQLNSNFGSNQAHEFAIELLDDNSRAINLTDMHKATKESFVNSMTEFVMAMRYYEEVTRGSRNPISHSVAYYTTFDLDHNLKSGAYSAIDQFVTNPEWGFYKWLDELGNHEHAFRPYNVSTVDKAKDMRKVLAHTELKGGFLKDSPVSDSNFADRINSLSKNAADKSARGFFKTLHDATEHIHNNLKY